MYFGFENISCGYGRKAVLENISFRLKKGESVSLIGTNGCGKSTLLKTISGSVRPYRGTVYFDGLAIGDYKRRELARRISYLPQNHSAPADLDVYTLVSYGRYPYLRFCKGLSSDDKRIIERTISMTGLSELAARPLSSLSGGEVKRAFIAFALCSCPEVLILDEPCAHLDIGHTEDVMTMLRGLSLELGMTMLTVHHDINTASRYSDRLIMIHDKGIYADGTPDEVMTEGNLSTVFGIDALILHTPDGKHPYFIPKSQNKRINQ